MKLWELLIEAFNSRGFLFYGFSFLLRAAVSLLLLLTFWSIDTLDLRIYLPITEFGKQIDNIIIRDDLFAGK